MQKKLMKWGMLLACFSVILSGCSLEELLPKQKDEVAEETEKPEWEENSAKVEEIKKMTLEAYPDKTIGEALTGPYEVVEWKYKEEGDKRYILCNYRFEHRSRSIVFYVDEYGNVNAAEYYIAGQKQPQSEMEKGLETMFASVEEEQEKPEATPTPTLEPEITVTPAPEEEETDVAERRIDLYPGEYLDERCYGDNYDRPENPCTVIISNVTETSFDFKIMQYSPEQSKDVLVFKPHTAYFTGDGTTATYLGKEYTLNFTFPYITSIQITGFGPVEGAVYANNSIPGYEFS